MTTNTPAPRPVPTTEVDKKALAKQILLKASVDVGVAVAATVATVLVKRAMEKSTD